MEEINSQHSHHETLADSQVLCLQMSSPLGLFPLPSPSLPEPRICTGKESWALQLCEFKMSARPLWLLPGTMSPWEDFLTGFCCHAHTQGGIRQPWACSLTCRVPQLLVGLALALPQVRGRTAVLISSLAPATMNFPPSGLGLVIGIHCGALM